MTAPPPPKNAPRKRTLYEILGVERDANAIDIGVAYKRRVQELGRAPNPDPNELGFVHDAYHILCMPEERAAYDASLLTREEKAAAQAQSPDLVLEPEPVEKPRRPWWIWVAAGAAILAIAIFFALRPEPAPEPRAKAAPEPAPAPAPPPPPQKKSAAEILAAVSPGVVRIVSHEISGRTLAAGNGLVTEPGHVVTPCHGLPVGGSLVVQSGADSFPASLVVADETLDLCRLGVAGLETRPLALAAEEARADDAVYLVGSLAGAATGVAEGRVKQLRASPTGRVLEITMPVPPGASGAGLFDAYGRLVGIATVPHRHGAGAHVALPASWLAQVRARARPEAAAQ